MYTPMGFWNLDWLPGSGTKLEKANKKKADILAKCKAEQDAIQLEISNIEKDEAANPTQVVSTVAPEPKQETGVDASNSVIKPKTEGGGKRRKQKSSKKVRGGKRKNTRRK